MVERDLAEKFTKDAIYKLIRECQEAGLVQTAMNRLVPGNIIMCNCCACCCNLLNVNKKFREVVGVPFLQKTNFVSRVDEDTCTGCGECVNYCQLEALHLTGDIVEVNEQYCMGCGVCVSKCPTESLSLVRISRKQPPELELEIVGSGV